MIPEFIILALSAFFDLIVMVILFATPVSGEMVLFPPKDDDKESVD